MSKDANYYSYISNYTNYGLIFLISAAKGGYAELIESLIWCGVDVNDATDDGYTALMAAT
ncbi:MAG: hypothetical protein PG981_001106 [Wolbachia endosymbiont of Ctenocephalides orientis wCori]|nr:MAG: hypothetical protein PG981_001106 [Wolbachia endosymbiont of Ctenocephalides orientis wCori]